MNLKSILSFFPAVLVVLTFSLVTFPWPGDLLAQDKPADQADDENKDDGAKPDGDKPDGDQKAPSGGAPAPSVGANSAIRAEADSRINLYRSGQVDTISAAATMTAADAATTIANFSSLTSLSLDYSSISTKLSSAGMKLSDVFGTDYAGVSAILAAGSAKQAALESAINTALSTDNSNVSNAGFRRAVSDAALDTQKDIALLQSVVTFAESVASPDSDFAKEVGSASDAWEKISLDGLGATIQGIESKTVEANDAGFDPAAVVTEAASQIDATSALLVTELISSAPVTEKNADGEIDYSNHLNGAVAQKLVIDEAISEGTANLTDLVKPASEAASILKTAVASAEAVSHVSKEIATTIAADLAAGNTPTKTAFDPQVAGKKVADVIFKKAEKVKEAAVANVASGETFTFDSTVFSPAAGAKVAETVYDVAENLDAATDLTFEATEALYDFAADFISDDATISATDVDALTLDASVLETIYVFADDVVTDAGAGATVAAFDPEALEAVYTFAEDFKADAIAAGGTFDASTTFDAGKLEALEVMYEFAEDVAADAGANFDAGSAGAGGADYFNPEALEAMFDFAEDMHKDAVAGGQEFDASTAFADAGKLEALEVMYEFAEDVAADAGAGFEADFNPEALEAMFDFAEDMHKDAIAGGQEFDASVAFADAGKLEALEVMYEFAEDVAADAGAGFEADFNPEALEAMFDFAEDMHKDAVAAGGTFEASTAFADAGKLEALEVIYEFAEDVAVDAGTGFEADFDPEALETIFDFAEDMHKDAVAAGGTFEASTAFDASKLEAIEAVYEFAEDLSLEGGDGFEADFDPEALEALYLYADNQVDSGGLAGGAAFDPEALEAIYHIADDAVDEAGFDPNVGFDLQAFDVIYDYADAEADKAGFDGAAGFDPYALEALYEFADAAVDEAGFDPNVGFDPHAFDALYDMADAQADKTGFDPNAGFDVQALDAIFDMAEDQAGEAGFDPNAGFDMTALGAIYEFADAQVEEAGFDPNAGFDMAALGALYDMADAQADEAGFVGFETADLDYIYDVADAQSGPIDVEALQNLADYIDDVQGEGGTLSEGGLNAVFEQIDNLAEGATFNPDDFDNYNDLGNAGVEGAGIGLFNQFSQATKDKFFTLKGKQINGIEVGEEAAARLMDGLDNETPESEFVELIDLLDKLDSQQLSDLLVATSAPADVSPTKPPLFDVVDTILGDMDERGLTASVDAPNAAFVDTAIELAEEAGANANPQLFAEIGHVADDLVPENQMFSGIPNFANALMEAGKLANTLLTTVAMGQSQFNNPQGMDNHYQTRSRLLSNGYNIHVIRLLGKYAFPNTSANVADKVAAFLENTTIFPGTGQNIQNLRDLFDDQNQNTDVLGARNLGDGVPFGKIPRQDPDDYGVIGGKKVYIDGTGNLDLSSYLQATPDLAIAGVEEVSIWNAFTISGGQKPGTNAGLAITAPTVTIQPGLGVAFDGLYLAVGTEDNLVLDQVSLQNDKHLGLASLGDVTLTDVSLLGGYKGKVYVYAQETLTVDGATFSQDLSQIHMEARTVNLSNVDFPYGTDVILKSELGGINGKYPNFGTVEAGRVNFLNNVKYGGNLIQSQQDFDVHGYNIKIGVISTNP